MPTAMPTNMYIQEQKYKSTKGLSHYVSKYADRDMVVVH